MKPARLVTLVPSHFCEKARWALERNKIPFEEDAHIPILHRRYSGGRSTPCLFLQDGTVLEESSDIVRHAYEVSGRLDEYVEDNQLDELFSAFGVHTRRLAYFYVLNHEDKSIVLDLMAPSSQGFVYERSTLNWFMWALIPLMKKGMRIDAKGAEISKSKVDAVFQKVEELLADGRRYLGGDNFSNLDIAFCALASPLLFPVPLERYNCLYERAPEGLKKLVEEYRETVGGKFVLRVYKDHREEQTIPKSHL